MAQSVAMFYLTTEGCKTDGLVASEITPSQSPDRQRSWRWNGPNSYERRGEIMPECLFCRREFENFTDEHVFPAAIGGKLMLRNATCADCNNGISKKFEQHIAGRLLHFRRLLSLKDRRGEIPVIEIAVHLDDQERRALLLPDGSTVLRPRVTKVTHDGGRSPVRTALRVPKFPLTGKNTGNFSAETALPFGSRQCLCAFWRVFVQSG
jgi:HNH endonuclease